MKFKIATSFFTLIIGMNQFTIAETATPPLSLAHFNEGWPENTQSISGMPNILSITSSGVYSFAVGLDQNSKMNTAFFDGSNWTPATLINNMPGVSSIIPLYDDGTTSQAFAYSSSDHVAFFNGANWGDANTISGLQNFSILSSAGHAFAISTLSPIKSSLFNLNNQTWCAPFDLSSNLHFLRAASTANGTIYLAGINSNGNALVMSSNDNQTWATQALNIDGPYNMQVVSAGNAVFVSATNSTSSIFDYSLNQAKTWHNISWPGGMLLKQVNNGIVWDITENNKIAYFNSTLANPAWQETSIPSYFKSSTVYSNPSFDGSTLCIEGDQNGPDIACYNAINQQWQNISSIAEVANDLVQFALLNANQIAGFGSDKNDKPALFYYNGETWQVDHVSGMNKSIQNMYFNGPPSNIWVSGHN